MRFLDLSIEGLKLITPEVFEDDRGVFRRNYCEQKFEENGVKFLPVQGNISENPRKHTLRGFHFQKGFGGESKLITPISGEIYNVVIDLRPSSISYLNSVATTINAKERKSLFVPSGCANAFLTLEDNTVIHYYMGDFFKPESYAGIRYDDPHFRIYWPFTPALITKKDLSYPDFTPGRL